MTNIASIFIRDFSCAKKQGKKFGSRLCGFPYFHFSVTKKGAIAAAKKEWADFLKGQSQAAFESNGIRPSIETIEIECVQNI